MKFKNNKNYKYYKRGQIVYVNFNSSIGMELKNPHYAIVLTKNDNIKNGVLTVVPLSSKNKPYYINLGELFLYTQLFSVSEETRKINKHIEESEEFFKTMKAEFPDSKKPFYYLRLLLFNIKYPKYLHYAHHTLEYKKKFPHKEFLKQTTELMNQESFAMVGNITTISKDRIVPLTKYPMIENCCVPKYTMQLLNKAIQESLVIVDKDSQNV